MSTNQKRILLVEDNEIAAKIAKMILETLECQVDHVEDGSIAVKQVLERHYDGICMDIGLPIMSGIEACKVIRTYETEHHLPPVPIVALTGNNSDGEVKTYRQVGMQEVIEKPFTKEKAVHFLSFCK